MSTLVSVFGANLGDTLWVTPLARYERDLIVWMRGDDAKACAVAPILDGLCTVRLEPDPPETRQAPIRAHVTQRILAAYGHGGKPSVPRVILTKADIDWAMEWTWDHRVLRSRTICLVNHCSGSSDPTNQRAAYVRGKPEAYAALARFWRGAGYKVLQFGPALGYYTPDPFVPIEGCIHVRGLTVRQLAAVYHIIGKLISPDTGDYWLMLAVGGKAACLVPLHSDELGYRHWDLHLDATCWGDERARVRYVLHSEYHQCLDTNLFNDLS